MRPRNEQQPVNEYYDETIEHVLRERLPILGKLQQDPDELYLRIESYVEGNFSEEIHWAVLMPATEVTVDQQHPECILAGRQRDDIKKLAYPVSKESWSKPFIEQSGTLLGRGEIASYLTQIQDDPMYTSLLYQIALELTTTQSAIGLYRQLPEHVRQLVVVQALQFIDWYPNSWGGKNSVEVKSFPKAVQLLAIESGYPAADELDPLDWYSWNSPRLHSVETLYQDMHADSESTSLRHSLDRAISHWSHTRTIDWQATDF